MKNSSLILTLLCAFLISGCSLGDCLTGEGEIVTEEIEVDEFTSIELEGSIDVTIKQGVKQGVSVTGYENIIPHVSASVDKTVLTIDLKDGCYRNTKLKAVVTATGLLSVNTNGSGDLVLESATGSGSFVLTSNGSGDIEFYDLLNVDELEVTMRGSGDIIGKAGQKLDKLTLSQNGSGDFSASNYQVVDCTIQSNGSGDSKVWVEKMLDVSTVGSGDVHVKGKPKITKSNVGSGDIIME